MSSLNSLIDNIGSINFSFLNIFKYLRGKTFFSFNRDNDIEIKWQDINKIGEDVILVKPGNNE